MRAIVTGAILALGGMLVVYRLWRRAYIQTALAKVSQNELLSIEELQVLQCDTWKYYLGGLILPTGAED